MKTTDTTPLQTQCSLRPALVMGVVALVGFGALYSLAGTGLGRVLFPVQATGSVVTLKGAPVGSTLVAQPFVGAHYLQPRPSAAKYDPMAAAGSNQARTNPDFQARIEEVRQQVAARDGVASAQVAEDLLTQSGSGLDPEISAEAAEQQVARIAKARALPETAVRNAIASAKQGPQFGLLGPSRVNVLQANLALDALK